MACFNSKLMSQRVQSDYEAKTFEVGIFEEEVKRKELEIKLKELDKMI